jgi:chromosomal replication initiator protein
VDEIIEYVARNIKSNVRELEGAIISLIAQSSFNYADLLLKNCEKCKKRNFNRLHSKIVSDYFQLI